MADAATISVLLSARDEASAKLRQVEGRMGKLGESFSRHRQGIGRAATGIGLAITGIGVLAMKSSLDQQKGIDALDVALKNIGTSYEANKAQIEALASAQQAKTNFGDEEQRKALQKLIQVTGDYGLSMEAMVPLMDTAAANNMDLEKTAVLVGRAISGEATALSRYGISLDATAGPQEVLNELMAKFAGQAEANADPITQLKNRLGDLMQVLGDALLPIIETILPKIELMIRKWIEFAEANPTLTKVIMIVVAAIGAALAILGPLLLILPQLFAGFKLMAAGIRIVTAAMAANPVGILLVALTTLAMVALPLVIKHWDAIWGKILKITERVANFIIGILNKLTIIWRKQFELIATIVGKLLDMGSKLPFVGDKFKDAADAIRGFSDRLGDGIPQIDITTGKQEELQDTVQDTASKFEDSGDTIRNEQSRLSVSAEDMSIEVSNAWGAVEDATMEMARTHAEELERMADEEQRSADLFASISKARVQTALDESQARKDAFWSTVRETERAEQAHDRTLNRLRDSLDETTIKWKESGLEMEDVVKRWAQSTDQSVEQVLDHWDLIDLDLSDLKDVFARFTEATGQDIFNWSADMGSASDAVSRALGTTAGDVRSIAMGIHDTIAGIHRDASRPVPAPRIGGFSGGGGGGGGGFASGIHVTDPGFSAATVAANQALAPLRGTADVGGIAGFAAGTTFAQIEAALGLANGGIVRSPTLAMIGERGPEAVIPLGKGGGMGTTNNFHFHGAVYGVEDLKEAVVEAVRDHAISGGFAGVFAEA